MPPNPILALLSVIALATYCALGCIIGAITARVWGWRWRDGKWMTLVTDKHSNVTEWAAPVDTPWAWIWSIIIGWPVWLAALAVLGVLNGAAYAFWGICYFPCKVGRFMITYVAQIGD